MPLLRFSLCAGRSETGDNALRSVDKTWQDEGNEGRGKQQKNNFTLKPVFFGGKLPIVL